MVDYQSRLELTRERETARLGQQLSTATQQTLNQPQGLQVTETLPYRIGASFDRKAAWLLVNK